MNQHIHQTFTLSLQMNALEWYAMVFNVFFAFSEHFSLIHAIIITTSTVMMTTLCHPLRLSHGPQRGKGPKITAKQITRILLLYKAMSIWKIFQRKTYSISGQEYTELNLVSSKTFYIIGINFLSFVAERERQCNIFWLLHTQGHCIVGMLHLTLITPRSPREVKSLI